MKIVKLLLYVIVASMASYASATLKIDINQGNVEPLPIAINDFHTADGSSNQMSMDIRSVIEADLKSSGLFKPISKEAFLEVLTIDKIPGFVSWRQIGAMAVIAGSVKQNGNKITVDFKLWDPSVEAQIEGVSLTVPAKSWRRVAHIVADKIYSRITGEGGYFDTRVLYVSEAGSYTNRVKKLMIMDQDGENVRELTDGENLVITPRFDPKAHRAIYMSYKNKVPQVYLLDIHAGEQKLLGKFPGMSFAPRFSPVGNSAVMSIAKDGTTDVYELNIDSGNLKKLTSGHGAINTSPSYSPDGSKIVFCSDRGGTPQLYVMDRDGSNVKRISYGEGSSSAPVWSPRGDYIAFSKMKGGLAYIGVIREDGSGERLLTSSWMDEGPTWAPNGRVIMFSRQQKGAGYRIYSVDLTGYNEKLVTTSTDASDPAWSPLLPVNAN